jgi:hypothetical protein
MMIALLDDGFATYHLQIIFLSFAISLALFAKAASSAVA